MTTRTVAVIGGMTEANSFKEAMDWVEQSLEKAGLKRPDDTFIKGDAFEGIFFARFPDGASMNQAVEYISSQRIKYKGKPAWSGQDRPLQERVPRGFLFGMKRMLVEWGFNKKAINVIDASNTLAVEGEPILTAGVESDTLKMKWLAKSWEEWKDLTEAVQFQDLRKQADSKLTAAKILNSKGKGKGKPGSGQ